MWPEGQDQLFLQGRILFPWVAPINTENIVFVIRTIDRLDLTIVLSE